MRTKGYRHCHTKKDKKGTASQEAQKSQGEKGKYLKVGEESFFEAAVQTNSLFLKTFEGPNASEGHICLGSGSLKKRQINEKGTRNVKKFQKKDINYKKTEPIHHCGPHRSTILWVNFFFFWAITDLILSSI